MEDSNRKAKLMLVMAAIVQTVMEGDQMIGTPGGHLYAALMSHMSLDQFTGLMNGLVNSGALVKKGQCYHVTPLGREYVQAVGRIQERMNGQAQV